MEVHDYYYTSSIQESQVHQILGLAFLFRNFVPPSSIIIIRTYIIARCKLEHVFAEIRLCVKHPLVRRRQHSWYKIGVEQYTNQITSPEYTRTKWGKILAAPVDLSKRRKLVMDKQIFTKLCASSCWLYEQQIIMCVVPQKICSYFKILHRF